jgi:hypothetical protein
MARLAEEARHERKICLEYSNPSRLVQLHIRTPCSSFLGFLPAAPSAETYERSSWRRLSRRTVDVRANCSGDSIRSGFCRSRLLLEETCFISRLSKDRSRGRKHHQRAWISSTRFFHSLLMLPNAFHTYLFSLCDSPVTPPWISSWLCRSCSERVVIPVDIVFHATLLGRELRRAGTRRRYRDSFLLRGRRGHGFLCDC